MARISRMAQVRKMRARRAFVQSALQKLDQYEKDYDSEWMRVVKGMGNIFSSFFDDEAPQTRRKVINDLAAMRSNISAECMLIPQIQAIVELSKVVSGSMNAVLDSLLGIDDLSLDLRTSYEDAPEELDDMHDMEKDMPELKSATVSCPTCSSVFPSTNQMEKHLMICSEYEDQVKIVKNSFTSFLITFDCPICSEMTDSAFELSQHFINKHNIMTKYFGCKGCSSYFHSPYELSAHWKKEGLECENIPILWDKDDVKQKVEQLLTSGELSDIIITGATIDSLYGGMYAECSSCQEIVSFLQYENHIMSHHDNWKEILTVKCSHPDCNHYSANYVLLDYHKRNTHPDFDFDHCDDNYYEPPKENTIMVRQRGRPRKDKSRSTRVIDNHPAISRMKVSKLKKGALQRNRPKLTSRQASTSSFKSATRGMPSKKRKSFWTEQMLRSRETKGIYNLYTQQFCPICQRSESSCFTLTNHLSRDHPEVMASFFKCKGCSSLYKSAGGLLAHLIKLKARKNHRCFGQGTVMALEAKLGHSDGMGEELNEDDGGMNDGMDDDDGSQPFIPLVKTECEEMDESMQHIARVEVHEGAELNLSDLTTNNWAEEGKPPIKDEVMDEMTY